ncbi:lycopene beta-cyclase CrtY [Sphingosinicella rhizophila]|uniref:Lycopene beta-cyclase CrtY n=1 Tax=Sphingosinicella rhizophila TaxID=3050082 RepID=A0ABU3Q6E9_9SPHN|nr:lycopene beta-cyclase CrtY [Sphingosinicella sp. GR2756]MDT9598974.1 lycopene beta-cyclase CrtY [Sphingosinicella sp. GR2756]
MAGDPNRLIIAGGGLSGCLAALALAKLRPEVPILLIEQGERFGGNHIWSFFDPDVAPEARWLVDPLIERNWPAYDIAFPKRRRTIPVGYNSIRSDRLDALTRSALRPEQRRTGAVIDRLAVDHVLLAAGERIDGAAIIDARGPGDLVGLDLGWQKFVGRLLRFEVPHGLARPIVMDGLVDQSEGYRFVYCLPFDDHRMLVEDTYYSLSPSLDAAALGARIEQYVADRGWGPAAIESEEKGVLPVAMGGSVETLWTGGAPIPRLGLRGGFFHPTTGYSLPDAVRIALLLADQKILTTAALHERLMAEAKRLWRQRLFYRLLDRMLLRAAIPDRRYRLLEHFYRLDPALIHRFYAGHSTLGDRIGILSGTPPVPIGSAIWALAGGGRERKQ